MSNETALQSAILAALEQLGYHPKRNNVGSRRVGGRFLRYGLGPGTEDICLCVSGRWVALEVKDDGQLGPLQVERQRELTADGGHYFVVRSVLEAVLAVHHVRDLVKREQEQRRVVTLDEQRALAAAAAEVCGNGGDAA